MSNSKYNGNTAYDFDYDLDDDYDLQKYDNVVKLPNKNKKIRKKNRLNLASLMKTIGVTAIIAGVSISMIYQQTVINQNTSKIVQSQKTLATLQTQGNEIKASLVKKADLTEVENFAINKLGMQKIKQHQIVYINVNKNDEFNIKEDKPPQNIVEWVESLFK